MEFILRVRMGTNDAHYGGNLVDGARILGLFGDAATALLICSDGDEGLFVGYEQVHFKAPVYAGDFLEVSAKLEAVGNTSRAMKFEARKIIAANSELGPSAADRLNPPAIVASAHGTCVVPRERQRKAI